MTLTVGRCLLQQHYVKEDFAKRRVMSLKTAKNIAEILNLEKIDDLYEWIEVGDNE